MRDLLTSWLWSLSSPRRPSRRRRRGWSPVAAELWLCVAERLEERLLLSNQPPTVSGVAFTVTKYEVGYAVGYLTGGISDDHAAEGIFDLSVTIDGTWAGSTFASSAATEIYFETELSYGDHDVTVELTETERDTGNVLSRMPATFLVTVAPPGNDPATLSNLTFVQIEQFSDGTPGSIRGSIRGEITDATRGFSDYELLLDLEGDGVADDSATLDGDWETFAYEFSPYIGNQTVIVSILENDLNTGLVLDGGSTSVNFTVDPLPDGAPVMDWLQVDLVPEHERAEIYGAFVDDAGGPYQLRVDLTGDGAADETIELDAYSEFFATVQLEAGESVHAVSIVDAVSGQASEWVGDGFVNKAPEFPPSTPIIRAKHLLVDGQSIGTVAATDPNGHDLTYRLELPPAEMTFSFLGNGFMKAEYVPPALTIADDGTITITNPKTIDMYYDRDFKYTFSVVAADHPQNGKTATVSVTLYDDWTAYETQAQNYLNNWRDAADNLITDHHDHATTATNRLENFITDHITAFTGMATAIADLTFAAAAFGAGGGPGASLGAAIGAVATSVITNAVADKQDEGHDAIIAEIHRQFDEIRTQDRAKVAARKTEEDGKLATLADQLEASTDSPDVKAKRMYEHLLGLKDNLPIDLTPAPVNDIYGELLIAFADAQGFTLRGSDFHKWNRGVWWLETLSVDLLGLDQVDVAQELNAIGYTKGKKYSVN